MAGQRMIYVLASLFLAVTRADIGLIKVNSTPPQTSDHPTDFCVAYNRQFQPLSTTYIDQKAVAIVNVSDEFGCVDDYVDNITNKVVAVSRGNCTFAAKAAIVQKHGGKAVLIVDYSNTSVLSPPEGNNTEYEAINIIVAIILHDDFVSLMHYGDDIEVWFYSPPQPNFDPNMILMFSIAVFCVSVGSFLSAIQLHRETTQHRLSQGAKNIDTTKDKESKDSVSLGMGIAMSIGLVIFFCVSLTLLYFFYDYLVYIIIAIFCIAGINGLFSTFLPLWEFLVRCDYRLPENRIPCLSSRPQIRSLALLALATAFVTTWVVFRHESYAWMLQDIIGFCFCLYVMRTLHMPSLKACSVLLGLLFVYDIFFVFITPLFTKNGESVMVKVATGGNSKSGEQMPTVFKLPYFYTWAMSKCFADKYSLLGFGDVIVPGLLVSYNCAFDLKTQKPNTERYRYVYFASSCIAYTIGLILTGVGLYIMKLGQPALLYIVPCVILTTVAVALCRKELRYIWSGQRHCSNKKMTRPASANMDCKLKKKRMKQYTVSSGV